MDHGDVDDQVSLVGDVCIPNLDVASPSPAAAAGGLFAIPSSCRKSLVSFSLSVINLYRNKSNLYRNKTNRTTLVLVHIDGERPQLPVAKFDPLSPKSSSQSDRHFSPCCARCTLRSSWRASPTLPRCVRRVRARSSSCARVRALVTRGSVRVRAAIAVDCRNPPPSLARYVSQARPHARGACARASCKRASRRA